MAVGTFPQNIALAANTVLDDTQRNRVIRATGGTGGGITLTIPAAASNTDQLYYVRKVDADDPVTLDGAFDYVLVNEGQYVAITSNGAVWEVLWQN